MVQMVYFLAVIATRVPTMRDEKPMRFQAIKHSVAVHARAYRTSSGNRATH